MNKPTNLVDRLSDLKLRLRLGNRARARQRRVDRRWQVDTEISLLEDRCLLSRAIPAHRLLNDLNQSTIYVANRTGDSTLGPYTLLHPATGPGAVIFLGGTSPNTGNIDWGTVPQKSVTFTNNSNNHETIYPFLYSPNNNQIYDPIDQDNDEYRLYIGFEDDGKYVLGLPYGKTITVQVPLVFWNGGRADIATDGKYLLPEPGAGVNPYEFTYTASTYITTQGVSSSTDNGILMYYKANTHNAPTDPSAAAPGQLTEWTIRDKPFLTLVNAYDEEKFNVAIPSSELTTLVNYDVSYVDDMTAPVAISAESVPVPIQYIQNGTATTQGGTTTIQLSAPADALLKLLKTFPYANDSWQVKYNVDASTSINVGTVTGLSNGTVTVMNSEPVSGLPAGVGSYVFYTDSVTQNFGWTGANNDIKEMQLAMVDFTRNDPAVNGLGQYFGGLGWPKYYNPDSTALLKIPSGSNILINSPLTTKTSPFAITHYLLTSGNNGKQSFYNAHEVLDPAGQPTDSGDVVTLKVSGADLAAIKEEGGTWVLSTSPQTGGTNTIGTIDVKTIDLAAETITVTLNQSIVNNPSGYSYLVVAPPSDPYVTKLTDLWYSWANYYVNQFASLPAPGDISATVSADTDNTKSDTRILTLGTANSNLAVGMTVTGQGISGLITILKIDIDAVSGKEMLYLSAPVPQALNGQTVTFTVSNPAPIEYSDDPGLNDSLINADQFSPYASFAQAFAGSVYELLSNYSTVPVNQSNLPNRSMDVVYEAIGGNVGFLPPNVNSFTAITSDVRDLGKSVLRGVPNFITYPDQHTTDSQWRPGDWYPPPSMKTDGTDYNVFNLDPFVWFVHQKVGLSGYGFSFDDDVSDVGAGGASAIAITYASSPAANPVASQWFPSTPWGAVTVMATISPPESSGDFKGMSILTIQAQDQKDIKGFWQVSANDKNNGLVGAYVSTTDKSINIPANTNLFFNLDSNALQFVLSTGVNVKQTTAPIPITFTGYPPQTTHIAARRR